MALLRGMILKSLGGFFYVETKVGVIECKARGVLRQREVVPLVGDFVEIEIKETQGTHLEATIDEVLPRKSKLVRPPIANVDQLIIVASTCSPPPDYMMVDKLIVMAKMAGVKPVLIIPKTDLAGPGKILNVYEKAGMPIVPFSALTCRNLEAIHEILHGKISVFAGASGVGKSMLLNKLRRQNAAEIGGISRKLGRGRHTTRHVELFHLSPTTLIGDTPGFSRFDLFRSGVATEDDLRFCYKEFEKLFGDCRFASCTHTCEDGCAVRIAYELGAFSRVRYKTYQAIFYELRAEREKFEFR